ncbi:MAG: GNAT family N-acetyltransferase, partial [Chloroflexota bacterium]
DLAQVLEIDRAAFPLLWQNSYAYLELAFNQAAVAGLALLDGRPVGYQISTATALGGHLARLAVLPELHGHGIGYALTADLLEQFLQRGARSVTVNTQQNNAASLALYEKIGFLRTGEEYPIYQIDPHLPD